MSSNKVEIIISGPQGTGKTVFASVISSVLCALGVRDMVFFDESEPTPMFSRPENISDVKLLLSRQKIAIHVTNETIDLETGPSRFSVDDALELLLTPVAIVRGTHRGHDSNAALQNDPESKTHHTAGKSNCQSGRPEDRHANNT